MHCPSWDDAFVSSFVFHFLSYCHCRICCDLLIQFTYVLNVACVCSMSLLLLLLCDNKMMMMMTNVCVCTFLIVGIEVSK